jgi:hypothetical protein
MACQGCPYLQNYDLIWRDEADPEVMCVMLWCCAGPELQVRRGDEVILDEFFSTKALVYERAEVLRATAGTAAGVAVTDGESQSSPR